MLQNNRSIQLDRIGDPYLTNLPVDAATVIYEGSFLGLNSGSVRPLEIGDLFVGVSKGYVNNITGQAGDKYVIVQQSGVLTLPVTDAISTDIGEDVYAYDDEYLTIDADDGIESFSVVGKIQSYGSVCRVYFVGASVRNIGLSVGVSGYSGISGFSGISGYSGVGASGISGYSGVGASGISGYSGVTPNLSGPVTSTGNATSVNGCIPFTISAPTDSTVTLVLSMPNSGTINSLTVKTTSGTLTLAVKINGTSITGLSAVAVTSTIGTTNGTAANIYATTDYITIVISSSSSPVDLTGTVNFTATGG